MTLKGTHDDRPSLMASRLNGMKNVCVEVGSIGLSGLIRLLKHYGVTLGMSRYII